MFAAIGSHFRWLVEMGRPVALANQMPTL
jgi:hypothetical protein